MNQFDNLARQSIIVADTGDIEQIRKYKPTDATTNPSLIYKAAKLPQYEHLIDEAIAYTANKPANERLEWTMDRLAVNFAAEIAAIVPGVVSVEVDASIAFKPKRTANRARRMIAMLEQKGVPRSKILIKIAATWYGIKAAEQLEKEGIHCNLTLIFNLEAQAAACAEAGVTLISPFVGRVRDWQIANKTAPKGVDDDDGVILVRKIYNYYQRHGYKTIVMGASFRTKEEVLALAGCDKLTIGPKFLKQLSDSNDPVPQHLFKNAGAVVAPPKGPVDDRHFYQRLCNDPMALEKLHAGIRGFMKDGKACADMISKRMMKSKL
mmetsp:Transcript_17388/g.19503  ORF Transcript_17388/g.19503 Transcript_17388/m.19503 type:complete len:322 (+) Transcript_17388:28-993(+)|eukprot:CAMPEP_0205823792 /NCGR_PEP_ID=MMETSP0206-20130828/17893_1 /ASSEMBLY_ACC=CAM_ASM_000279 /TAXON_ID=36767 /ORGANISM="Euplotes focardii, Strain TN1" /LENGTH=321 /DNA_ID=CAMNT_0053121269 /DNA_START=28 /DNA_END=993 /DNA_ORIENTATION=+